MSLFDDVGDFHRKFDLPAVPETAPGTVTPDAFLFRYLFLLEELHETGRAYARGDLPATLDGLVDLVYVALGTAHLLGLPFDAAWAEVHAANLAKERASGADDRRSQRAHALDVVKPPGWQPPDLARVLRDYVYVHHTRDAS